MPESLLLAHSPPALSSLSIVHVEDNALDVDLTQIALTRAGLSAEFFVVDDEVAMRAVLASRRIDLVLTDCLLPAFSGSRALEVAREFDPDIPVIVVSGVSGEETAVAMMRRGATDFILKERIALLPRSIERALDLVRERTQRRLAEFALSASQVNMRLAADAARLGLWDYRPQTGELVVDARCREMFGCTPDDPLSMTCFERCVHPDDVPALMRAVDQAMSDPEQSECNADYRIVLPDGGQRWLNMRGKAFWKLGVCTQFVGVLMDVTERLTASEAIEQLNEALAVTVVARTRERDRIWALSHDMLAVTRHDLTPISLNPAWVDTLAYSLETLQAGSLYRFFSDEDAEATRERLRCLAEGQAQRFENRIRAADGGLRWLAWTAVMADDMLYCVVRDITVERARLDELANANALLMSQIEQRERAEASMRKMQRLEAVGQLTAGVAHDFNNLLTVVLSNVTFIERELRRQPQLSDRGRQRLSHITQAAQRGAKLTTQLLTFSRQQQLAPKAVPINGIVESMLDLLRSSLGAGIELKTLLAADLWPALADPTQIEMVILNLAINARDASEVGGALVIATVNVTIGTAAGAPPGTAVTATSGIGDELAPGDYVCLSVRDSGRGMSRDVAERAFEPFFTTKEVGKGSGLGLAQVYGFAQQSGGGVTIDSAPGEGTTVNVYLPRLVGTVRPADEPASAAASPARAARRRLLVIDDDDAVRDVTIEHLVDFGYQVVGAANGYEALERLAAEPDIDAMVVDFAMPGMNGAELAREVRGRLPELPVLFVTGYIDVGRLDMPRTGVLQKPYSPEQLGARLAELLGG